MAVVIDFDEGLGTYDFIRSRMVPVKWPKTLGYKAFTQAMDKTSNAFLALEVFGWNNIC
jgi:hypothetical protein